eukprot:TRINITY_DN9491_c0_g1_i1.p1 TRINITY_DN9491_c0_g1~~TRINITY_DN9491_c0_g1_i1.p1  ORF type:complete len:427 (-),score=82.42 TRINITY_DN9491_c0_g1_i1:304-1584(-)
MFGKQLFYLFLFRLFKCSMSCQTKEIVECVDKNLTTQIDEENVEILMNSLMCRTYSCKYSSDGKYFAFTDTNKYNTYIFDGVTGELLKTLHDHFLYICEIVFSNDCQWMATCSQDFTICVYRVEDFSLYRKLNNCIWVTTIVFSNCSNYIFSGDYFGYVKKWDFRTGKWIQCSKIHETDHFFNKLLISPNSKYLLTANDDKTSALLNMEDLTTIQLYNHKGCIKSIDFHPFETSFAVGDRIGEIAVYNLDIFSTKSTLTMNSCVGCLQYYNCKILIVMTGDGYITLFDILKNEEIQRVECGCKGEIFSFSLSPDQLFLCCGVCDGNSIKRYAFEDFSISSDVEVFKEELFDLSRNFDGILTILNSRKLQHSFIRQLVADGIRMNINDYTSIVDICWDLVDINERNDGNMRDFVEAIVDSSSSDEDD